jgi:prepilin-type N-terminal cleavage/methylation domain-containing protein
MPERIREARKNEKGFTLIELLIVIVILGVLAGIVVFAVGGITDTGKNSACKTARKTVETGVEAFRAQTGAYPGSIAALVPGYLHDDPTAAGYNTNYSIAYDPATHLVTGTITSGGGTC